VRLTVVAGGGQTTPSWAFAGAYVPRFPHTWYVCARGCEGCQFCSGGLGWCTVCGAFEGQLLAECPGHKVNAEGLEATYRGNVADMPMWRSCLAAGLHRRKGRWVASHQTG
jgi:hypothetical protein